VRYRLGRYEDAITDLVAAGARARSLGDAAAQVDCLLDEATALDWMNDFPRSLERLEAAEALAGSAPDALAVARLELARGRSHVRSARMREGDALLASAAARAEALGDDGYETLVAALLMRGAALPQLGRIEEAEQALDRALALANARGDAHHVASAHNNRRNVWVAKGNVERAVEDLGDFLKIGRDLGMVGIEYVGEFNLGELLYQAADLAAARAHVTRAVEIERRHPEVAARPLARLLAARLAAWEGDLAAARARLEEVRTFEAEARAAGREGTLLGPSDRILAEMVELAVAGPSASPEAWAALRARSRAESVEQEPIEVHEQHGLAALRAGRLAEAREALAAAQALAAAIPNVMAARLRNALARST
jgi:tetratricopeptide (TPR) repeat protein